MPNALPQTALPARATFRLRESERSGGAGRSWRAGLLGGLLWAMGTCMAQSVSVAPPAASPPPAQATQQKRPSTATTTTPAAPRPAPGGPAWRELTAPQQAALAPLAGSWNAMRTAQKRKWLALSPNFGRLSAPERERLHSRMVEWAALSPAQRLEARLNFAQTPALSAEEKHAQWEAYQALTADEKKALAARAPSKAPRTAPAQSAAARKKLADVPLTHAESQPAGLRGAGHPPPLQTEGESHATPAASVAAPAATPASH